jgi:hypothetical protein
MVEIDPNPHEATGRSILPDAMVVYTFCRPYLFYLVQALHKD